VQPRQNVRDSHQQASIALHIHIHSEQYKYLTAQFYLLGSERYTREMAFAFAKLLLLLPFVSFVSASPTNYGPAPCKANILVVNDDGWAVAEIRSEFDAIVAEGYNVYSDLCQYHSRFISVGRLSCLAPQSTNLGPGIQRRRQRFSLSLASLIHAP